MTTTRKITRIASIILTLAMLLSLVCVTGTVSAGAATKRVSLYSIQPYFSKYGSCTYDVFIRTNDNAKDQEVYVHYNYMNDKKWQDSQAELFTTLDDGSKIWKASFSSYSTKYCIKYIADGKTYWDNNNGKDYDYETRIGSAPVVANKLAYQSVYYQYPGWPGYQIDAVLQNYAYHKNVFVRYTTDGWKSHKDQALSYSKTNSDGTETWTTNLYLPSQDYYGNRELFQYAICYRVNGREYWANNFGENYDIYYYVYH